MNNNNVFNLDDKLNDIKINYDVTIILNDIVTLIEGWYTENEVRSYQRQIHILHENECIYNKKIKELEIEKDIVKKELIRIKQGAKDVREKLCVDISEVLYKSKHHSRLEVKVRELEKDNKLKDEQILKLQNDVRDTQDMIAILEQDMKSTANIIEVTKIEQIQDDSLKTSHDDNQELSNVDNNSNGISNSNDESFVKLEENKIEDHKEVHTLLVDFENDIILLQIFSYLNTTEVLNAAQCNRFVFKRVDTLFGIDSKLALEEWSIKSSKVSVETNIGNVKSTDGATTTVTKGLTASSIVSSALEAFGAGILPSIGTGMTASTTSTTSTSAMTPNPNSLGLLTQEMAETLSKKLTAIELKAIIAISERLKKKSASVDQLTVEKEDISARLKSAEEVRDFLVDKLKNAELALKATMHEVSSLKKQSSADNEVISFLDLKEQELNTQNSILTKKCERLQASYDLLAQSNTQNEQSLLLQLDDYKSKYEDLELSYKLEKKVLVKEVKSLRSQLETISVERNMYKNQITSLKQTLSLPDAHLFQSKYHNRK